MNLSLMIKVPLLFGAPVSQNLQVDRNTQTDLQCHGITTAQSELQWTYRTLNNRPFGNGHFVTTYSDPWCLKRRSREQIKLAEGK